MIRRTARAVLVTGAMLAAALIATHTGAAASASSAAVPSASVSSAAAADTCGGNLVRVLPLNHDGTRIGELQIYFNPANGNNCAMMRHGGPTWGVARETWVYIARCATTTPTGTCSVQADDSDHAVGAQYYAGPARVWAGAHCIQANGWIYWAGARRKVSTAPTTLCGT